MLELREVFDMVTKQTEPDLDSWKQQEDKQRRSARNKRIGAIAVAVAAVIAVGVVAIASRPGTDHQTVTSVSPPPPAFVTVPPIGPQIVRLDGTPMQQLPTDLWDATSVRWSPDGTTLVYIRDGVVYTAATDGTGERALTDTRNTNHGDAQNHVEWSPDGTKLAYAYSGAIYVMNSDGSGKHVVVQPAHGFGDYYPTWSEDGSTIAFWSGSRTGEDGGPANAEIYAVPVSGGDPTQLTADHAGSIEPAWSPGGKWIAFKHGYALGLVRPDGTGLHDLTRFPYGPWAPAWSPDGKTIAGLKCCDQTGTPPLLSVTVTDIRTGATHRVGRDLNVATDLNGVQWITNGELLINRHN